jgi:recombination associated protein RdgC
MWFKQLQIFHFDAFLSSDNLETKLELFSFKPCLPSMQFSMGWVPPVDSDNKKNVRTINGHLIICLQIEEKILPSSVIRDELKKKVEQIEMNEARKIRSKEKQAMKDEIIITLLPRAFSKYTKIHAYFDLKNKKIILNTVSPKKIEKFLMLLKKTMTEEIQALDIKKLAPIITSWLTRQNYPSIFSIEKSCVLQDPNHQKRVIRCQEQDLNSTSIKNFINEGCEVKQLALTWKDRVSFTLTEFFTLTKIKFQDEVMAGSSEMEAETAEQIFHVDFFIMTETLSPMLSDLLNVFTKNDESKLLLNKIA